MKNLKLFILIFIFPFQLFSQFSSENPIVVQKTIENYQSIDMDSDGDKDILSYHNSSADFPLGWYENIGQGVFGEFRSFDPSNTTVYIFHMEIADIDGDGIDDMVYGGSKVFWKKGLGNKEFGEEFQIADDAQYGRKIIVRDFDNDLDIDVFYFNDDEAHLLLNDGNGDFINQTVIADPLNSSNILAGDLDNDGDIDLIKSQSNVLGWYQNNGNNFDTFVEIYTNQSNAYFTYIEDLNQDGSLDILSMDIASGLGFRWFKNEDGLGSFSAPIIVGLGTTGKLLSISDYDGDSDLDILYDTNTGDDVAWIENLGDFETFNPFVTVLNGNLDVIDTKAIADDIDGDGLIDIISRFNSSSIYWYKKEPGLGGYGSENIIQNYVQANFLSTGDIDGDGDVDIVASSSYGNLFWFRNLDGLGTFDGGQKIPSNSSYAGETHVADVDGDGDNDLFVKWSGGGQFWHENLDGNGDFGDAIIIGAAGLTNNQIYLDFDSDGDTDILYEEPGSNIMKWQENENGQFTSLTIVGSTDNSIYYFFYEDLDNDLDNDIILYLSPSNGDPHFVGWSENLNNVFQSIVPINELSDEQKLLAVADMDTDGLKDLVFYKSTEKSIYYRKQIAGGLTFETEELIADFSAGGATNGKRLYYVDDMDADGDLDVVAGTAIPGEVFYVRNDIDSFAMPVMIGSPAFGSNNEVITSANINNNGGRDIIVGSLFGSQLVWYDNIANSLQAKGTTFYDTNENGIFDSDEYGLHQQKVTVQPNSVATWSNDIGNYNFSLAIGNYNLTCETSAPDTWAFTTAANVAVDIIDASVVHNFGLTALSDIYETEIDLSSAPTRCGFTVPFWIHYNNTGNKIANGTITLNLDSLTTYVSASPLPNIITDSTLIWNVENLIPTYSNQIDLELEIAGVDFIGDTIALQNVIDLQDLAGNNVYSDTTNFFSEINCAYDPNDKLVEPSYSINFENYALFGETLEYTIRFQNTGTDTAFTIRLEDQLDANLDLTTFEVVAASHTYEVYITETGLVNFHFNNILLPDVNTNELLSHGFVKYRIEPIVGLPENTVIENFADIYFDFNPPIITNTVSNILVQELPTSLEEDLWIPKLDYKVIPNPFQDYFTLEFEDQLEDDLQLVISDMLGRVLFQKVISKGSYQTQIKTDHLIAGIYYLELRNDQSIVSVRKLIKQ